MVETTTFTYDPINEQFTRTDAYPEYVITTITNKNRDLVERKTKFLPQSDTKHKVHTYYNCGVRVSQKLEMKDTASVEIHWHADTGAPKSVETVHNGTIVFISEKFEYNPDGSLSKRMSKYTNGRLVTKTFTTPNTVGVIEDDVKDGVHTGDYIYNNQYETIHEYYSAGILLWRRTTNHKPCQTKTEYMNGMIATVTIPVGLKLLIANVLGVWPNITDSCTLIPLKDMKFHNWVSGNSKSLTEHDCDVNGVHYDGEKITATFARGCLHGTHRDSNYPTPQVKMFDDGLLTQIYSNGQWVRMVSIYPPEFYTFMISNNVESLPKDH